MKKLIDHIKSARFQIKQKFNSIYKLETDYVVNAPSIKSQKQLTLHPNTYPQLDKFFLRFANSRPIEGRVSGKSLAFVIGAQNVGKTQYINKNLIELNKKIQQSRSERISQHKSSQQNKSPIKRTQLQQIQINSNTSPEYRQVKIQERQFQSPYLLLIKKDYKINPSDLNFLNFVQDLHEQIVKQILRVMIEFEKDNLGNKLIGKEKNKSVNKPQKQQQVIQSSNILTAEILKDILLSIYSDQYLYIHLKDVVFAILEEKDMIRLSKQGREVLEEFNSTYLQAGKNQAQYFFNNHFLQLTELIHQYKENKGFLGISYDKSQSISKTLTAMELFYSISQRMEYEHRPQGYDFAFYKSGIETTDFLFEVVNFLTGVGKYVQKVQTQFKDLQQSDKQEWMRKLVNKNNFILNGNHVDSLIILSNIEHLLCFKTKQPAFLNWIDHVILRTVQSSGFRHHFPIMIEMPNRKFLDQLLQLGKMQGSNPVIVQIPGYIQSFIKFSNLIEIFQQKRASQMFNILGRNPHTWKNAIENMAKGVDYNQIINGQAEYQNKQKLLIEAKINRVYTDVNCLPLLNKGYLDYEIMNTIRLFEAADGMGRAMMSFLGNVFFKKPHFQAMLEKNIFFHHYYLPYMDYSSNIPANLSEMGKIRKRLMKNNSYIGFLYWKYFVQEYRIIVRDLKYRQIHEKILIQNENWDRQHSDLQFWTTYYGPLEDYQIKYDSSTKVSPVISP